MKYVMPLLSTPNKYILKQPTVASKKYIKQYKSYPKFKPKPIPLIGCIYKGRNRSNHIIIGMLIELEEKSSTLKTKDGKKVKVKSDTLISAQLGY